MRAEKYPIFEMVRASFQADVFDFLEPIVTEEENGILHRGRNETMTQAKQKTG